MMIMKRVQKSDITKKYQKLSHLFNFLSVFITVVPIVVYIVLGFINGEVQQKLTLGVTVTIAMLLTVVNVVFKYHMRSAIWVLVLGIYFCLKDIMPLLLLVAVSTILDEFILTPLHKSYKSKAKINKEIDRRMILQSVESSKENPGE